jgi:hypothetical protein
VPVMEPTWLSALGDIGSALGGLTIFTGGIGYLLKLRGDTRENRRLLAVQLDGLTDALKRVAPGFAALDSYVPASLPPSPTMEDVLDSVHVERVTERLAIKYWEAVSPYRKLDAAARGTRQVALAADFVDLIDAVGYGIAGLGEVAEERWRVKRQFDGLRFRVESARSILLDSWTRDTRKAVAHIRVLGTKDVTAEIERIAARHASEATDTQEPAD